MNNIYLARVKKDSYTISRVGIKNKITGVNGETMIFIQNTFDFMPDALGLVTFPAGTNMVYVAQNTYFFLDRKSAMEWVEETLSKTTFEQIDVNSPVYIIDDELNIHRHRVTNIVEILKDRILFNVSDCKHAFLIDSHNADTTSIVRSIEGVAIIMFSDIKDAAEYVKRHLERKIENLQNSFNAQMTDLTDKLNKVKEI